MFFSLNWWLNWTRYLTWVVDIKTLSSSLLIDQRWCGDQGAGTNYSVSSTHTRLSESIDELGLLNALQTWQNERGPIQTLLESTLMRPLYVSNEPQQNHDWQPLVPSASATKWSWKNFIRSAEHLRHHIYWSFHSSDLTQDQGMCSVSETQGEITHSWVEWD